MDVRKKLEVIAHLGDHISYKEDIGICYDSDLAKVIEDAYMELKNSVTVQDNTEISEELLKQLRNAPLTILKEEPTIEVVQEWISVKDRLPEDDLPKDTKRLMIRCLVFTDKGTVKPCVRQRWKHFDGQLVPWQWNKDLYAKPTHWMPLPEPPKGE